MPKVCYTFNSTRLYLQTFKNLLLQKPVCESLSKSEKSKPGFSKSSDFGYPNPTENRAPEIASLGKRNITNG